MKRPHSSLLIAALALLCPGLSPLQVSAQDATNLLLVINEQSPASEQIGTHYASRRAVPADNILRLSLEPVEEISRETFRQDIRRPIAEWLTTRQAQDRILYIVLTKGIPLRVQGPGGRNGSVASVDSELTLLYRALTGQAVSTAGRVDNPYFLADRPISAAKPFSHKQFDIYLVSRLDGFSVDDVITLIDRGSAPSTDGVFLLDPKSTRTERGGDAWLLEASNNLAAANLGDRVVFGAGAAVARDQTNVLGYYSWGSNDPAIRTRHLNLEFVPGGLAGMFVSTDGRTFEEPPEEWEIGRWPDRSTHFARSPQSLIGDLIRSGATGVVGHVTEPYLDGTVRPQILFPSYIAGANLIEAFYLAMPFLSWQSVVVGDPLCAPFRSEQLTDAERTPPINWETELPEFFSTRRVASVMADGTPEGVAKLRIRADGRIRQDDPQGARDALDAVLALDPTQFDAHLTLASLDEETEAYDDAIARYRTLLSLDPDHVIVLNNLAYSLAQRKGQPDDALPLALNAYQLSQGLPQIADTLGWIHHLLGNHVEATRYLNDAVGGLPNDGLVRLHLAHVQAAIGSRDEARATLEKAIELDPALEESPEAVQLRNQLGAP